MIVVTDRASVGSIRGQDVYRVSSFQILPLPRNLKGLSPEQVLET